MPLPGQENTGKNQKVKTIVWEKGGESLTRDETPLHGTSTMGLAQEGSAGSIPVARHPSQRPRARHAAVAPPRAGIPAGAEGTRVEMQFYN